MPIRAGLWAAIALGLLTLGGCAAVFDPAGYRGQVDAAAGGTVAADEAMLALDKGNYGRAEDLAVSALKGNPKDAYAAYVLAQVYLNTGRSDLARKEYEMIVSLNAQQTIVVGSGDNARREPLAEVAKARLAALFPSKPMAMTPPPSVAVDDSGNGPDGAFIRRFKTLQMLLDAGLITRDEFDQRRGANLGALLPYVAPPPAVNLDLPAPAPSEIVDRMQSLVAAYQGRSISAVQQQTERQIILDNLLPGPSARRADAPKPIEGAVQAAEVVGRLTRYREAGVITADEETKAKKSVMAALEAHEAAVAAQKRLTEGGAPTGEGIRLGTYGSEDKAAHAWAALQKQFPNQLGTLKSVSTKVALRRGGSVWRLNAGPVADRKAALALCREITRHRQSCTPTVLK
jgi:hypothetical protein